MAGSLTIEQHQVFINFRGEELRYAFLSHLVTALENHNINVNIHEDRGESLEILLERIEESRIALVFVSGKYTESTWCLRELARIKDCVEQSKLVAIPIFYKLDPSTVRHLRGQFGDAFRDLVESDVTKKKEWEKALNWIPSLMGIIVDKRSNESKKVDAIVVAVKRVLLEQEASVALAENIYTGIFTRIKQHLEKLRHKLDLNKIRSQLGMIIVCLLLLFSCLQQVAYMSTLLIGEGGAINRIVENVPKGLEYFPAERTVNANFLDRASTNSPMDGKVKPPNIQVFINFRGEQLRKNFVGYLVDALRRSEINVFIDNHEQRGEDLNTLFTRIEDSGIAIVVFSSRYTESKWCLEELVKIKERVHQGLLKVLPIYYKVTPTNVKRLKGEFGDHFRDKEYMYRSDEPKIKRWKEAIVFVSHKFALTFDEKSSTLEIDFVETIVKEVLKILQAMSIVKSGQSSR